MKNIGMKIGDLWTTYEFRTTYVNGWDKILSYAVIIWGFLDQAEILTSPAGCRPFSLVKDRIKERKDILLIKEASALIIRGKNRSCDHIDMQFSLFNGLDVLKLQIPTGYLQPEDRLNPRSLSEEEKTCMFDKFVDSLEIQALCYLTKREAVKEAIKGYMDSLLNYDKLKKTANDADIAYGWQDLKFPLDEVIQNIRSPLADVLKNIRNSDVSAKKTGGPEAMISSLRILELM